MITSFKKSDLDSFDWMFTLLWLGVEHTFHVTDDKVDVQVENHGNNVVLYFTETFEFTDPSDNRILLNRVDITNQGG